MAKSRKNWVLAGLILALGAAVYLNWQFSPSDGLTANEIPGQQEEEDLGSAQYVDSRPQLVSGETAPVAASAETFSGARGMRTDTRKEALETLQMIIDDASLDNETKTAAVEQIAKITERMEAEAAIETLVKAKGYADCVAVISDTQVNVVIPAKEEGITPADAAMLNDIVIGQFPITPNSIKIIEAK